MASTAVDAGGGAGVGYVSTGVGRDLFCGGKHGVETNH